MSVEAALDDLEASIAAVPKHPTPMPSGRVCSCSTSVMKRPSTDYDKVLELAPNYSQGYAGRALAHISLEHIDEALADYEQLIELEPQNPGAYLNRALIYASTSNYEAALEDTNTAIELLPDDASLYLQRAAVYQALDKTAEAAQDYLEWITRQQTRGAEGPHLSRRVASAADGGRHSLRSVV